MAMTLEQSTQYAESLARSIWEKHYRAEAPNWEPISGDLYGLLSQIGNMVTGMDHLSAQAKVRVSGDDFECIKDTIRNHHLTHSRDDEGDGYPLIDALSVGHQTVKEGLEEVDLLADAIASALDDSFAARLSQGAQGEAVSVINIDDEGCAKWSVSAGDLSPGKYWLYTHSAERAAVPDGWVLMPREPTQDMLNAARDWSIRVNGIGVGHSQATGCYQAMLTAAPQPPEGARVVDGDVRLWDTQWMSIVNHDYCYRDWSKDDAIAHAVKMTEEAIARNVADGKLPPKKIAAPALAGKEGA